MESGRAKNLIKEFLMGDDSISMQQESFYAFKADPSTSYNNFNREGTSSTNCNPDPSLEPSQYQKQSKSPFQDHLNSSHNSPNKNENSLDSPYKRNSHKFINDQDKNDIELQDLERNNNS